MSKFLVFLLGENMTEQPVSKPTMNTETIPETNTDTQSASTEWRTRAVSNILTAIEREKHEREKSKREQEAQTLDELLAALEFQAKAHRKMRRGVTTFYWLMGAILALVIVTQVAHCLRTGKWGDMFNNMFMFSFFSMAGSSAVTAQYKSMAQKAAAIDDIRVVGPLCDTLATEDKDMRKVAEEALTRLLPRVQASDAALFTATQRESLVNSLWQAKPEYVLVVLKALEQIGDAKALPMVERLARGDKDVDVRVIEAARQCLPALRQRAENAQASQTLLRGASAFNAAPNTLVRPAMPTPLEPANELMRPAGNGIDHAPEELLRAAEAVGEDTAREAANPTTETTQETGDAIARRYQPSGSNEENASAVANQTQYSH